MYLGLTRVTTWLVEEDGPGDSSSLQDSLRRLITAEERVPATLDVALELRTNEVLLRSVVGGAPPPRPPPSMRTLRTCSCGVIRAFRAEALLLLLAGAPKKYDKKPEDAIAVAVVRTARLEDRPLWKDDRRAVEDNPYRMYPAHARYPSVLSWT